MKRLDFDLQKVLNKIIDDGYTTVLVKDKNKDQFFNWFFYLIEGVGTGYIEKDAFGIINISSEYISENQGSGARFKENINPDHIPNHVLVGAVTFAFSGEVEFIKDLRTLLMHEEYWFPYIRIFKEGKEYTPYDFLQDLDGVYIVRHGPNYKAQLYDRNPKLESEAVAVRIENGDFIEIKGELQDQINLLKEVFPYIEEEELRNKLKCF